MAVFLVGDVSISLASESELEELLSSCSKVENDAKRLACFDEHIPSNAGQPTAEKIELQGTQEPIKERWNFKFDNGEVWQQIEPRYVPKLENFPVLVNISEGVFGNHDLRAEDFGKVVKVKRLK
jgi:hypothetical protein